MVLHTPGVAAELWALPHATQPPQPCIASRLLRRRLRPRCADLWICLICGHVGCGRYRGSHAALHWQSSGHGYALELETQVGAGSTRSPEPGARMRFPARRGIGSLAGTAARGTSRPSQQTAALSGRRAAARPACTGSRACKGMHLVRIRATPATHLNTRNTNSSNNTPLHPAAQRVWDYVNDTYVHRLIQSKTDGKLVEVRAAGCAPAWQHPAWQHPAAERLREGQPVPGSTMTCL